MPRQEEDFEDEIDDWDIPEAIRESRMAAIKQHAILTQHKEHGVLVEVPEEREVLTATTSTKRCIVHFYHPDYSSCAVMNGHLATLAPVHFQTKFVKFNVQKGPWLCQKLKIQTLPAVVCFIDGIAKDRIIGFDELGNTDKFSTAFLEGRLAKSGVINPPESLQAQAQKSVFGFEKQTAHNDDDDD